MNDFFMRVLTSWSHFINLMLWSFFQTLCWEWICLVTIWLWNLTEIHNKVFMDFLDSANPTKNTTKSSLAFQFISKFHCAFWTWQYILQIKSLSNIFLVPVLLIYALKRGSQLRWTDSFCLILTSQKSWDEKFSFSFSCYRIKKWEKRKENA